MVTVSDNFNRTDGSLGANWTQVAGTWTVASNTATRNAVVGSTVGSARYATDLASSDNYAQVTVTALQASSDVMSAGAACRYSPSAATYYFASLQVETNGTATMNLGKVEAGTLTILTSTAGLTTSYPETVKVQAVGSTIKAFRGGTEVLSVTDTSITSGTRAGVHGRRRSTAVAWNIDDFIAEDVGGGATQQPIATSTAATSTSSGAVTLSAGLAATASATTAAVAVIGASLGLAVTTPAASTATEALTLRAAVTSTTAATSTSTSAIGVVGGAQQLPVATTTAATSTTAATVAVRAGIASVTAASSGTVAQVGARYTLAATSAATSGAVSAIDKQTTTPVRDVTFLGFDEQQRVVTFTERQRTIDYTGGTMRLDNNGREFYNPGPSTEPAVSAWEASFDNGATWKAATTVNSRPVWLVAGPDAEPGAATVLTRSIRPLLRAVDNPELVVRAAPQITLT